MGQCEVKVKKDGDLLRNTEKYFEYNFDVHTGGTELSTGDHKFPFQIQLPPNLPTSFEGESALLPHQYRVSIVWFISHVSIVWFNL